MSLQTDAFARPGDADIQAMLAKAVRLYAERATEADTALPAFPPGAPMTATEVMVTVSAMLKAVNLQVFELGMWQSWSGKGWWTCRCSGRWRSSSTVILATRKRRRRRCRLRYLKPR